MGKSIEISNLSCHAAGYVVNGPEMYVWGILCAYYTQEDKVVPVTKDDLVTCLLEHPSNNGQHSKTDLEEAINNLAGAGRNGPIKLRQMLTEVWDGTLLPTKHFGIILPRPQVVDVEAAKKELTATGERTG